jgi:N-acetylmuramoyl-L-alanine amidase
VVVANFNNQETEANRIKRETKYALIFAFCAIFSVLPFSMAADASGTASTSTQISNNVASTTNGSYGLKIGDNGAKVVELQKWLKNQGYYVGNIDGDFGPYTKLAVEYFQTDSNIVVDGWVADQTVGAMNDLTGGNFTLSSTGSQSVSTADNSTTATTCKSTTKATTSKVANTTTNSSKVAASKVAASNTTATTSKSTTSSSSSLSAILASGAKYGYSHSASTAAAMESCGSGDCWAMSDYLYSKLSAAGISCRIVQYSTAYSSNHRSVQLHENGAWVDVPYSSYGYNMLFHATSSKPGMTVLASC